MDLNAVLCHFLDGNGRLISFPAKRKMKIYALMYIAANFDTDKKYSEIEVNEIINRVTLFNDPATVRRELYNNHFLNRENNGSVYWLEKEQPVFEELK